MKKIISLVVLCVLMLSLCACVSEPALIGSGLDSITEQPTTEPAEDKVFTVGDTVALNNIEVTFIGVTESTGSDFLKPADGNTFVLCEFEIYNSSDEELSVSSMMCFNAYYDDYSCDLSISALSSKGDKAQLDGTVAAGKKMRGVVGYEIPTNWQVLEIHYTPSILSDDKIVFSANHA